MRVDPPADRSWQRMSAHAHTMIAGDFFTVDTLWLARLYVLFFSELGSRRVHLAGCTARPSGEWVAQQARNLSWSLQDRRTPLRFLIHDRDSKFTRGLDEIFRTEGLQIIRTPFRAPKANAVAERFVRTVRVECLDWLLIAGRRQLERTLRTFIDHYNTHRPHRALGLTPPHTDRTPLHLAYTDTDKRVRRRDRLGGLIHEYRVAA
jgi:putative transposase